MSSEPHLALDGAADLVHVARSRGPAPASSARSSSCTRAPSARPARPPRRRLPGERPRSGGGRQPRRPLVASAAIACAPRRDAWAPTSSNVAARRLVGRQCAPREVPGEPVGLVPRHHGRQCSVHRTPLRVRQRRRPPSAPAGGGTRRGRRARLTRPASSASATPALDARPRQPRSRRRPGSSLSAAQTSSANRPSSRRPRCARRRTRR